jgi:hypothetical protein
MFSLSFPTLFLAMKYYVVELIKEVLILFMNHLLRLLSYNVQKSYAFVFITVDFDKIK